LCIYNLLEADELYEYDGPTQTLRWGGGLYKLNPIQCGPIAPESTW
jgi:hypothetical protein